jgi:hypothetical protein
MLQPNSDWPEPKGTHVRILIHKETSTHTIDFTEDGILAISLHPHPALDVMPEYVKQSAPVAGYAALNRDGIDALWEALREIKLTAS